MRIGIVGYGNLGKFLVNFIVDKGDEHGLELDFIWNRTLSKVYESISQEKILVNLADVASRSVDMIVEVAHPGITEEYGSLFLSVCDYFIGSPTALADAKVEKQLLEAITTHHHGLYIPSGAFWGAQDIQKMASANTLRSLTVTMKKHPSAFRLRGGLKKTNDDLLQNVDTKTPVILYEGPVRELCSLAPNNVNTMAAAAIAASNLGFDGVTGRLVADTSLKDWHIVEVEVVGDTTASGNTFTVSTTRRNPSNFGVVTGSATSTSFCNSMVKAGKQGPGLHMC